MSAPLRVGVVGAGTFGEQHIRAYTRRDDVTVVAIADTDPERAREVAARWGIDRWFAGTAELVDACRPDGISVVTPASHHRKPTLAALAAGCPVLLEKPAATSAADAAPIVAADEASSAFVMPAHILRFAAPLVEARARLRDGAIGRLLGVSSVRDRGRGHATLFPDVHPAHMTTIHDIDLALWLSGSSAVRVSAQARGEAGDGRPLLVWARVEAADGSVWSLRTSWLLPDSAPASDRLEIYGTEGTIAVDLRSAASVLGPVQEAIDHELTPAEHPGAIDAEIAHFCACIRHGTLPTVVTLADAVHGLQIADAAVASARDAGAWVRVGR